MTFVLNPALALAYAYVLSDDHFLKFKIVAAPLAFLAVIYNVGAYTTYFILHKKLELLLRRLIEIESVTGGKLQHYFRQSVPWPTIREMEKKLPQGIKLGTGRGSFIDVHGCTKVFFAFVIAAWLVATAYGVYEVCK